MDPFLKLNKEQICSIKVRNYVLCNRLIWKPKKTVLLFFTSKEGFYETEEYMQRGPFTKEYLEEGYYYNYQLFVDNYNRVWYKPSIYIRMSNNQLYEKTFESPELLNEFIDNNGLRTGNWVFL